MRGPTVSRRRFLEISATAAGALLVGVHVPTGAAAQAAGPAKLNAWVRIDPDGMVTVVTGYVEMGQGALTAIAQMVAEELEVPWERVRAEHGPATRDYADPDTREQSTGGSRTVPMAWSLMREAGATAREMLRAAAASTWGVPVEETQARDGVVHHEATGRSLPYGGLAAAAAEQPKPRKVRLKSPEEWRLIGTSVPRVDTPAKITGTAVYGIDVDLEGMLVGAVLMAPVPGGRLVEVDPAPALAIAGVHQVVRLPDAVVALADHWWAAKKAVDALDPVWDDGPESRFSTDGLFADMSAALGEPEPSDDPRRVQATYRAPYLAHATMEPMTCAAEVTPDGVRLWSPTQTQTATQKAVAKALGIGPAKVSITTPMLGGGFGRRGEVDFSVQAALVAKEAGRPVKLIWSREEDMTHDFYRAGMVARLTATLDESGLPTGFHFKGAARSLFKRVAPQWAQGRDMSVLMGIADMPYSIPDARFENVPFEKGLPVGAWRSVGHSHNAFFLESFVDEMAAAGGRDPVELRRALLASNDDGLKVLDQLVEVSGWNSALPADRFRGLALHTTFGICLGQVVEISRQGEKAFRVEKVVNVVQCGLAVNPSGVEAQVRGGVVYGLSAALYGEITAEEGRVRQTNFDTYRVLRMDQMPQIEVHHVEGGRYPKGLGEASVPPVAPALASALFAATGERLREMPFTKAGFRFV